LMDGADGRRRPSILAGLGWSFIALLYGLTVLIYLSGAFGLRVVLLFPPVGLLMLAALSLFDCKDKLARPCVIGLMIVVPTLIGVSLGTFGLIISLALEGMGD